jgi:hypothetical protein
LAALDGQLPPSTATGLRDSAFIGTLMRALARGECQRLYAAGSLGGPRWQPTCEARHDAVLRGWVFTERPERDMAARAAGGITVIPRPEAPRRRREVVTQPPRPASSQLSQPFDPEALFAAIQRAIERLDEAEPLRLRRHLPRTAETFSPVCSLLCSTPPKAGSAPRHGLNG